LRYINEKKIKATVDNLPTVSILVWCYYKVPFTLIFHLKLSGKFAFWKLVHITVKKIKSNCR